MKVVYLVDMSHQHLESRGHIFTNRASIAYLPTRLQYGPPAIIMIGEPPTMMLNYVDVDQMLLLTRTVLMTLCIRLPLVNSTTSRWLAKCAPEVA